MVAHLKAVVQSYFALELILLPYTLHPHFKTIAGSRFGSLYAPVAAPFDFVPTWMASFYLTFCVGLSLQAGKSGNFVLSSTPSRVLSS